MPQYSPPEVRFAKFADKSGGENACWPWTGSRNRKGYGAFIAKINGEKLNSAHRAAWVLAGNELPPVGMVIDHICDNPSCVNPAHLRVTTNAMNVMVGNGACAKHARKDSCVRGHRLSGDNLLLDTKGYRQCRVCFKSAQRRWGFKKSHGLNNDHMLVLEAYAAHVWFAAA